MKIINTQPLPVNPAIELAGVSFSYGGLRALNNIDLRVPDGEFLGIVGPNAGGKSTLLKILLGILEPQAGVVRVLGKSPRRARRGLGYVPQYPNFRRDFPITVLQVMLTSCFGKGPALGPWRTACVVRHRVARSMALAGPPRDNGRNLTQYAAMLWSRVRWMIVWQQPCTTNTTQP